MIHVATTLSINFQLGSKRQKYNTYQAVTWEKQLTTTTTRRRYFILLLMP